MKYLSILLIYSPLYIFSKSLSTFSDMFSGYTLLLIFLATFSIDVSNIYSCAGNISIFSILSIDLWLIMLKCLIESISSPHNSILIPVLSVVEISIIPPLTLNSPLPSIRSNLWYPRSTNFCFRTSKSHLSPTLNFRTFLYKVSFEIIFCFIVSTDVTIINFCFL